MDRVNDGTGMNKELNRIFESITQEVRKTIWPVLDISYSSIEFNPQNREFKICFSICTGSPNSWEYLPEQIWIIPIDLSQGELRNLVREKWRKRHCKGNQRKERLSSVK